MLEWSLELLGAVVRPGGRRRAARTGYERAGRDSACAGGRTTRSESVRNALAAAAGGRRWSSCTTRRGRSSTPTLVRALRSPRWRAPTARSRPRRVTDTVKEAARTGAWCARSTARGCGRSRRRRRSGATCCGARSTRRGRARRGDRRRLAGGARRRQGPGRWRRRPRTSRSPRAHDLRMAEALPAVLMLTDYHVHLRPDERGHAAGALLHRRQRRALPRGRGRARDRGAGRGRARLPLHAGARGLGAPLVPATGRTTTSTRTATSCASRPT